MYTENVPVPRSVLSVSGSSVSDESTNNRAASAARASDRAPGRAGGGGHKGRVRELMLESAGLVGGGKGGLRAMAHDKQIESPGPRPGGGPLRKR